MGLALTLGCDIRIAGESGRFCAVFVKRGLMPDTGTSWMLPRIVGPSNAFLMMYQGNIVSAEDALRMGLVSKVVPDGQLMDAARELAGNIAANPPLALELTKRVTYQAYHETAESTAAIEMYHNGLFLGHTEDAREGIMSFVEKRKANFVGR
jgi:2-(1,2-epoxy-1,2-dihydrophenyl)acetyl-CoA isomerase